MVESKAMTSEIASMNVSGSVTNKNSDRGVDESNYSAVNSTTDRVEAAIRAAGLEYEDEKKSDYQTQSQKGMTAVSDQFDEEDDDEDDLSSSSGEEGHTKVFYKQKDLLVSCYNHV